MDNSLPDELISEILSPALKVSDEAFSDNHSRVSPFATYSESPSAYLLVNKDWLRVATPLIYNVVVFRSAAQAKALARALSKNEQLARFIKKLRVEGGYGVAMKTILSLASNITDLFLSLEIFAADNTDGLCQGLALINPTRLIVQHSNYNQKENKNFRNLVNALTAAFTTWEKLVAWTPPRDAFPALSQELTMALNTHKRLTTLYYPTLYIALLEYHTLALCPIAEVHITQPLAPKEVAHVNNSSDIFKSLVRYKTKQVISTTEPVELLQLPQPSLNPHYKPMANEPKEIQDLVWSTVLSFTMALPEAPRQFIAGVGWSQPSPGYLSLLLVSKSFYTLSLPLLYTDIVLRLGRHPMKIAATLNAHPFLAADIRSIGVGYALKDEDGFASQWYHNARGHNLPSREDAIPSLRAILSKAANLHTLRLITTSDESFSRNVQLNMPWGLFADLPRSAGSSLRELAVCIAAEGWRPVAASTAADVLRSLPALEKLWWKCSSSFTDSDALGAGGPGLPHLEELQVQFSTQSFVDILCALKPHRLRRLALWQHASGQYAPFLQACGANIVEMDLAANVAKDLGGCILDLCPNLALLNFEYPETGPNLLKPPPAITVLQPTSSATKIATINFHLGQGRFKQRYFQKEAPDWHAFLTELPCESMPNLNQIFVQGFIWPTNQRDISKSEWVRAAEALLEFNVHMVDEEGNRWRSRLRR